jgi:hypothetical protein
MLNKVCYYIYSSDIRNSPDFRMTDEKDETTTIYIIIITLLI